MSNGETGGCGLWALQERKGCGKITGVDIHVYMMCEKWIQIGVGCAGRLMFG